MGIRVVDYSGEVLIIAAPLANNINHQQSAFGGSLFSLAALAGWGLMQLKLTELDMDGNTVIAGGGVTYSRPVFEELVCRCAVPPEWPTFEEKLRTRGKGSIGMASTFHLADDPDGEPAMAFEGNYVVRLRES